MPRIAVVIPQFNKEEYTRKCIELVKKNYGTGEPIEIVVVDDGSEIPFVDPLVNVVRHETNMGFTAAANTGILWAQVRNCDYVLLLNNDTEPYPGFLQELVLCLEANPAAGIAASVRIHPERGDANVELMGSDLIRGYQYFTDEKSLPDIPIPANWIPLCSGLLRMDMVRDIGILDKRFRNHCSDSNYCIQAKMRGWGVLLVPTSKVIHHLSVSTTAAKISPDKDQALFLEILSGYHYANLLREMPLDGEAKTFGQIAFSVYKK